MPAGSESIDSMAAGCGGRNGGASVHCGRCGILLESLRIQKKQAPQDASVIVTCEKRTVWCNEVLKSCILPFWPILGPPISLI
jgi:hypothetical protein